MSENEFIVLRNFLNRSEADIAASHLRANGIECWMEADDAGGMYPSLKPVKLLVRSALAEEAQRILSVSTAGVQNLSSVSGAHAASVAPFGLRTFRNGIILGLIIGALIPVGFNQVQTWGERVSRYDDDEDGFVDHEQVWHAGEIVDGRMDRNSDGQFDYWISYRRGVPTFEQIDSNFDGKVDGWYTCDRKDYIAVADGIRTLMVFLMRSLLLNTALLNGSIGSQMEPISF